MFSALHRNFDKSISLLFKQRIRLVNPSKRIGMRDKRLGIEPLSIVSKFSSVFNRIIWIRRQISLPPFSLLTAYQILTSRSPQLRLHFLNHLRQLRLAFRLRRAVHIITHTLAIHSRRVPSLPTDRGELLHIACAALATIIAVAAIGLRKRKRGEKTLEKENRK